MQSKSNFWVLRKGRRVCWQRRQESYQTQDFSPCYYKFSPYLQGGRHFNSIISLKNGIQEKKKKRKYRKGKGFVFGLVRVCETGTQKRFFSLPTFFSLGMASLNTVLLGEIVLSKTAFGAQSGDVPDQMAMV